MAYFDNASTTYPKPESVYSFMDSFYRNSGGNVGRGNYTLASSSKEITDETRKLIQEILHCHSKQVIFTATATIALNLIIQGAIKQGLRNVYISPFEHNAVTRTLHHFESLGEITITKLSVTQSLEFDLTRIKYQFDSLHPDLVVVSHASNVIGLIAPAEDIFLLAKAYGAVTLLDMAQTAGLVDIDVGLETIDYAVFAGHKTLLGPTGISGFVMKPSCNLPPILFGGTGYDSANQDMPESPPEKYEVGTLNIAGIAGLNAALKWIKNKTIKNIWEEESRNRERLLDLLSSCDFLTIVGNAIGKHYVGIVSCVMDDISSDSAGNIFAQRGISVRTGLQCAPMVHHFIGTYPAGTIRFSVNCLTYEKDFDELKAALDDIRDAL